MRIYIITVLRKIIDIKTPRFIFLFLNCKPIINVICFIVSFVYNGISLIKNILFNSVIIELSDGALNIMNDIITMNNVIVENFAHNGYIEILYQLGCIFFVYLVLFIKKFMLLLSITIK